MGRYLINLAIAILLISAAISIITFIAGKNESFRIAIKSIVDNDFELYFKNDNFGAIYKVNTLHNIGHNDEEYYCNGIYMQKGERDSDYNGLIINIKNLMQDENNIIKSAYSIVVEKDTIICCRVESEESPKIFADFFKYNRFNDKVEIVKQYAKDISVEKSIDLAIIVYYGDLLEYKKSEYKW